MWIAYICDVKTTLDKSLIPTLNKYEITNFNVV
jgi:hypothetical protein